MSRPTVIDLAQAAGVSTATVDRVLNGRPGVSARTRALVEDAARRIGYLPPDPTAEAASIRLVAVLPSTDNPFMADLAGHLQAQAAQMPGVALRVLSLGQLSPEAMAEALDSVAPCQGLAVIAQAHPLVQAALRRLMARGTKIVTLSSDLPTEYRLAYIGVDNAQAGRLAGQVLGRFLGPAPKGKIAFFAGSLAYRGHQEREMGLRQVLAEDFPELQLLDRLESREVSAQAEAETHRLLDRHPDVTAIYNAGAGTGGIARALEARGAAQRVLFVAHDVTERTRSLLLSGTLDAVIDQNARIEAQEALLTLAAAARGQAYRPNAPRLALVLRENLPADAQPRDRRGADLT